MPTNDTIVPPVAIFVKETGGRRVVAATSPSAHLTDEAFSHVEIKVYDGGLLMGAVDLTVEEIEDILAAALAERAAHGRALRRAMSVTERLAGREV